MITFEQFQLSLIPIELKRDEINTKMKKNAYRGIKELLEDWEEYRRLVKSTYANLFIKE